MQAAIFDSAIFIDRKAVSGDADYVAPDADFGTQNVRWHSLTGTKPIWAEVQDVLPSRSMEQARQGLVVATDQSRVRFPFRDDVDSSMRVRINRGMGEEVFQIVAGPALINGRQQALEIVVEKYSS